VTDPLRVVVDPNILFSTLLSSQSRFTDVLFTSGHQFYVCELVLVEMFKHKEKIVRLSKLSDDDIVRFYHILLRRLTVYKEDLIAPEHRAAALALCDPIDATDTPHVALTLEIGGLLWTGDNTLKQGLQRQGFSAFFDPSVV
jgi:predicted nucleic acid-binding protein